MSRRKVELGISNKVPSLDSENCDLFINSFAEATAFHLAELFHSFNGNNIFVPHRVLFVVRSKFIRAYYEHDVALSPCFDSHVTAPSAPNTRVNKLL